MLRTWGNDCPVAEASSGRSKVTPSYRGSLSAQFSPDPFSQLFFGNLSHGSGGKPFQYLQPLRQLKLSNALLFLKEAGEFSQGENPSSFEDHASAGALSQDRVGYGDYGGIQYRKVGEDQSLNFLPPCGPECRPRDPESTRLNSTQVRHSYAVF